MGSWCTRCEGTHEKEYHGPTVKRRRRVLVVVFGGDPAGRARDIGNAHLEDFGRRFVKYMAAEFTADELA
jgi:hypothetical protein